MPRHCPHCGDIVERKRYAVPPERDADPNLGTLDVWECECGWAEDVEDD